MKFRVRIFSENDYDLLSKRVENFINGLYCPACGSGNWTVGCIDEPS